MDSGSKLSKLERSRAINDLENDFNGIVSEQLLNEIISGIKAFLFDPAPTRAEKMKKVELRNNIMILARRSGNRDLIQRIAKQLYRPINEMYIPIPNSTEFHHSRPNFFCKGLGLSLENIANIPKSERTFNLVFEPSGDVLPSFITQQNGKAIESYEKQSILGEWILRGIFQLDEYEPLTLQKMREVGINGIRLYKTKNSDDVHLQFIWIDNNDLPEDFIE